MIFGLVLMFMVFGLLLAGLPGLIPGVLQHQIPDFFRLFFIMIGGVIQFIGFVILHGRADKTGCTHLLEFGKPGTINWLYVYKDGEIKITPSMRDVESQLYSKDLDAQIRELKSYRIFDHSIRIVPEGVGHATDLDMVLYANLLRSKWGFQSIRGARKGISNFIRNALTQEQPEEMPEEKLYIGDEDE